MFHFCKPNVYYLYNYTIYSNILEGPQKEERLKNFLNELAITKIDLPWPQNKNGNLKWAQKQVKKSTMLISLTILAKEEIQEVLLKGILSDNCTFFR